MSLSLSATRLALPLQPMTATVHRLGPLHYRNQGPMMTNELVDGGPATVLHLSRPGQPGHGELLVASERIQAYDRAAFDSQGIDLGIKRVILIKTSAHFRASYTALASAGIVLADSGGWASPDMRSFAHANRQRPTLPLQVLDLRQWERAIEQEVERQ